MQQDGGTDGADAHEDAEDERDADAEQGEHEGPVDPGPGVEGRALCAHHAGALAERVEEVGERALGVDAEGEVAEGRAAVAGGELPCAVARVLRR